MAYMQFFELMYQTCDGWQSLKDSKGVKAAFGMPELAEKAIGQIKGKDLLDWMVVRVEIEEVYDPVSRQNVYHKKYCGLPGRSKEDKSA